MSSGMAARLTAALRNTPGRSQTVDIDGAPELAMVKAMQRQGILPARVDGMPVEPDDSDIRWQRVQAYLQREREAEEIRKAKAEALENPPPQTALDIVRCAVSGASSPRHLPLNTPALIRHAMASLGGSTGDVVQGLTE